MKKKLQLTLTLLVASLAAFAEGKFETVITPQPGERWWGGAVSVGHNMPYSNQKLVDFKVNTLANHCAPLLVSSKGRYVWGDATMSYRASGDTLYVYSDKAQIPITEAGSTLREAYLAASAKHFPPTGGTPDPIFFSVPQYNTWIELQYNQNQTDILAYADAVLKNGFPTGVFMIDDNWQKYYGNFEFKPERFPDAKGMVSRLHNDGFRIMLWLSPFISPDSWEFRMLESKGYLVRNSQGATDIYRWWNGFSATLDFSNPEARAWLVEQLRKLQRDYGIDGFKFDAADSYEYTGGKQFHKPNMETVDMTHEWNTMGFDFPYNEFRTGWNTGGLPLVNRLNDKPMSWEAVATLVPHMLAEGIIGNAYTCPDMVGGGLLGSFLNLGERPIDQELFVRSCQIHAMMPMMQFSVAPWRILDAEHLAICRDYANLHKTMGDYILQMARHAAQTGEPIVRYMEYEFPHQGFQNCNDQYMLGDKYMVAPMVTSGTTRTVQIPRGVWIDDNGKKFKGPKTITTEVPIQRLPIYTRVK